MSDFRFVILGAAKIAVKFCDAVRGLGGCAVTAVASKSAEKAKAFAEANNVPASYDDYERMLIEEKPDAAYIAVTPNDHYRLSMLCVKHGVPVLCEKAMFLSSAEAETLFAAAEEKGVFVMEAMWSRFLPSLNTSRQWLRDGRIGDPEFAEVGIGFRAPKDPEARYFNPKLGGGTAYDIVCYGWEILTWMLERKVIDTAVIASKAATGVDATSIVALKMEGELPAVVKCSFMTNLKEELIIYGSKGRIEVPSPHYGSKAVLYGEDGNVIERFEDTQTQNGFVYEIAETMRCVSEGLPESPVVPHKDTAQCAKVFDRIVMAMESEQPV